MDDAARSSPSFTQVEAARVETVQAEVSVPDPTLSAGLDALGLEVPGAVLTTDGALRDWYLRILETLPAAIYATDASGVITFYNKAAADLAGRRPTLGVDKWCVTWRLYQPDGTPLPHGACPMAIALKEQRAVYGLEAIAERPDGTFVPFQPYPTPLRDADGTLIGALNMLVDITERKKNEARIHHLAHHDPLTDLPNRTSFEARLARAVTEATLSGHRFAVLWIDLDRFKDVNDAFGHSTGDQLLRVFAGRLREAAFGAFVARMGGDEFAVIVEGCHQPRVAERVAEAIFAGCADAVEVNGHALRVGLSIGVAIHPNDGGTGPRVVAHADAAMYRAKAEGRGGARFFDADLDERLRHRRDLKGDLEAALAGRQMVLHYQPQVRPCGGTVGFEALVRWRHPTRGLIAPADFIPLAEECGTIIPMAAWILHEACREAAGWAVPLKIAVNLSPVQFRHGDLLATVRQALHASGLAPERLELEITEGVLTHDFNRAASVLRRLKALGVGIAMDDFGTGYSSLSYLHGLPFSKVKIDGSLVAGIGRDERSAGIVRTMVRLGHVLDLEVAAEGVETAGQLAFLRDNGCDELQGFLVGAPAPVAMVPGAASPAIRMGA